MTIIYGIFQPRLFYKILLASIFILTQVALPVSASQQSQVGGYDINVSHGFTFTGNSGDAPAPLSLRGYDAVSYFTEGKPQLGSVQHAAIHNGAIYWFASEKHKKLFVANPEHYLPQYGGFCAFGVTQKTKFDGDPLLWNIHKGKLYLNVTPDLQAKWLGKGLLGKNLDENIADAENIWPAIRNAKPEPLFEAWLAKQ